MGRFISNEHKDDFICYSSENLDLLRLAQAEFSAQYIDDEIQYFEQQDLDMSELYTALGTISFFSEKRIAILRFEDIAKLNEEEFTALCSAIEECEQCRVVVFLYFKDRYSAEAKNSKALKQLFTGLGAYKHLATLTGDRLKKHIISSAGLLGSTIEPSAIELLVNKFSGDMFLLENEIQKAAALAGYDNITVSEVEDITTTVLSADVFSLVSLMLSGDKRNCFFRLAVLLEQGHEPIAILAAVGSSFVDIYRVQQGKTAGKRYSEVFKDFGYKGSDYRLKKASEFTSSIGEKKMRYIMKELVQADLKLKSTAADREIVLYRYLIDIASRLAKR